jgi:preprotein translocase subunit SecF
MFNNTNYDFLRWRNTALAVSLVVTLAGAAVIATRGIPLGVEFEGGTSVIAQFEQVPSIQQVRGALDRTFGGENVVVQTYGNPDARQVLIRVPQVGAEEGTSLSTTATAVKDALTQANLGMFEIVGTEIVGPAVGDELRSKGLLATVGALGGILLYLTFRYQLSFAMGAVIATLHDLLVVASFLAFFQYELTLNVIAGILTIAGYSGNDTIVIFDRVRENQRSMRRDSLAHVINVAVNQTLSRTVITAGTTLLSAIALFLFGGEVLRGFAFVLIVGIITGTYSTVFIAAAIVTLWRRSDKARGAAVTRAPAAGAVPPAPQQPTRRSKPQRKARAS